MKIPDKPKIPPPFPVQLQDGGPIQILAAAPPDHNPRAQAQAGAQRGHKANAAAGPTSHAYAPGATRLPPQENYPGGAGRRPGPAPIDEDDPSIYYPPPYSFFYPKDNSSAVPPGPLVPGIVLPPPPNFFGRLLPPSTSMMPPYEPAFNEITTSRPQKPAINYGPKPVTPQKPAITYGFYDKTTPKPGLTTPAVVTAKPIFHTTIKPVVFYEKTTRKPTTPTKPATYGFYEKTTPKPAIVFEFYNGSAVPAGIDIFGKLQPPSTINQIPANTTQEPPKSTTTKFYLPPVVTTPSPPILSQSPKPVYVEYFETNKLQPLSSRPSLPVRTYVSSTAVPLRAFFKPPTRPAQFYFYEEDPRINEVNTQKAPPRIIIATLARPQQKQVNNFEHHIQQLRQQIRLQQQRQQRQRFRQPRPVYQYSFGFEDAIRPTPQPPRYNVQIQPSVNYNRAPLQEVPQIVTPNPIINQQNIEYQQQYVTPNPIIQENIEYRRPIIQDIPQIVTPNPTEYRRPQVVTQNPLHAFYTKQEYDKITQKYFTVFGQKITSPLPPLLRNDLNVNYRRPLPPHNPQAEYIVEGIRQGPSSSEGGPGTFISYRLPGDGAHFYFLTPQLAQQQQQRREDEQSGYFYPEPRLRRRT